MHTVLRKILAWGSMGFACAVLAFFALPHYRQGESSIAGTLAEHFSLDLDGKPAHLEDFQNKVVVLNFWASWCGPCKQQLPAVQKLHDDFVSTSHVAIISLSLDDDPVAWHGALKEYKVPWSHGRFRAETNRGVSSVPSYWLLDPTGKILVKSSDIGEIRRRLDEAQK